MSVDPVIAQLVADVALLKTQGEVIGSLLQRVDRLEKARDAQAQREREQPYIDKIKELEQRLEAAQKPPIDLSAEQPA